MGIRVPAAGTLLLYLFNGKWSEYLNTLFAAKKKGPASVCSPPLILSS
jgi:hypothetical protein